MKHCPKIAALRALVCLIGMQLAMSVSVFAEALPLRIAIVSSGQALPYQDVVNGFKMHLNKLLPDVEVDTYLTSGDLAELGEAVQQLSAKNPAVVVALGTKALREIGKARPEEPVVGALIINANDFGSVASVTGILLDAPPIEQFNLLKRLLPKVRRVGVLYNSRINAARIKEAEKAATVAGLMLDAVAINSPTELPIALKSLARRVDVIWGIPDAMVMSSKTARDILLASFRHRVPLVGPSSSWTKAGALYALEWDYADIGAQTADMAAAIIKGNSVQSLPIASPRTVGYSLNLKTAKQINIRFSDELISQANRVIKQ